MNTCGDLFFWDGRRESNILRFTDVAVGDKVHIDNRAFLAFCYSYRHHISPDPAFDFLRLNGAPIYPQHGLPLQSPLMGVPYCGQYEGKLLWVHHTHDSSLWPPQGVIYEEATIRSQGAQRAKERFCLRWTENAEHISPAFLPTSSKRATTTWLIDYMPIIEQSLVDLCDWAEKGIVPAGTTYQFSDGKVTLPATAGERGGIQPVVSVTVNGSSRADVKVQLSGNFAARGGSAAASVISIIAVEWSLDGSGAFTSEPGINGQGAKPQAIEDPRLCEARSVFCERAGYVSPGGRYRRATPTLGQPGVGANRRDISGVSSSNQTLRDGEAGA